ncbi:MAG TPA: protein kinase, partial [Vicinamibacterales bacterium]|nr:protein kinase [Vicinamibacterales bacterium]
GITHRDIKLANLMLTPRGQVKVLDFGIAKTARSERLSARDQLNTDTQTGVGLVMGSVPYMSPEQVLGREVDERSDLFSLGIALYEMATGRLPFAGATPTETMDQILHAPPEPIVGLDSDIPSELKRITFKCLEKDLERRYQSAAALLAELRHLRRQADEDVTRVGEARRHNLPAQLTSFAGRRQKAAEIRQLFGSTRLLTLTGAGGCGKTRLALHLAGDLLDEFRDGVWLVDLSPLSEPDLVKNSLASILHVQEGSERSLIEVLSDYARPRQMLVVLDDCEHLIAACASLAELLLRSAPRLRVLATSREALGISGETVWRVPSLSVPSSDAQVSLDVLLECEAPRLFVERAATVAPTFALTPGNAATVVEICRRLDGIPLAIELAAARLNVLSVESINDRLNDRFRLLTGGSLTAVARQRTLEATVDWSYELLSKAERRLLCHLSVFAGGWTMDAAEAVCASNGIKKDAVLDLLSHLVDKSLVNAEENAPGNRRYRFLETVRHYAREHLLRSGSVQKLRDRHLDFFFDLARTAAPEVQGPNQAQWLNRLELEHDNLRAALEWCLTSARSSETSLRLVCALWPFWNRRNHFGEGRQWVERALTADPHAPRPLRARAFIAVADLSYFLGDDATLQAFAEQVMALDAEGLHDERWTVAMALFAMGVAAMDRGAFDDGATLGEKSLAVARETGAAWVGGLARIPIAMAAIKRGELDRARSLIEDAVGVFRSSGDKWGLAILLVNLTHVLVHQGEFEDAIAVAREGVMLSQETADRRSLTWCLTELGAAMAGQNLMTHAARLWGAVESISQSIGSPLPTAVRGIQDLHLPIVRQALGESFDIALAEGRAMTPDAAIAYALADAEPK